MSNPDGLGLTLITLFFVLGRHSRLSTNYKIKIALLLTGTLLRHHQYEGLG